MMGTPLLDIRSLTTEFTSDGQVLKAVNDVSLTLHRGETIGIVGESGSGKSVTSLSVMRLIPDPPGRIASGQIMFSKRNGEQVNLVTLPEKDMRAIRGNEIAMIFQEPMTSLNPVFTCGYQVIEAIMLHQGLNRKDARQKAIDLFKLVQLPRPEAIFDSYPHQISGGQKQRVMIAMAMSCNPSVLIADEPTTALDVTVQKTILDLMLKLQREHDMGILFITHDLGVIAELADRVVVMYKGRIVEQGPVDEIFRDPKHPYTKGLLACRPPLDRRLRRLPVVSDFMDVAPDSTLSERPGTVAEALNRETVTDEQRKTDHAILYAQEPVLRLKELCTWFPLKKDILGRTKEFVKAVDGVTFDVFPGETLGLVGESGCGKTTLGRTIIRLIDPTSGEVWFKGQPLHSLTQAQMRELRKDIQIIFQDPYSSLNPRITVGDAILEPIQVHRLYADDRERRAKVLELLERVNLRPEHYHRYPHEFSGGQRQRICIARALALRPQFIICDESVSALDVSVQAQVLNLLNELKRDFGFTYIFISHDLGVVKFMSDRMVVINKGVIEEMGDADQIYHHPQTDYTRKLISAIPKGRMDDIERSMAEKRAWRGVGV